MSFSVKTQDPDFIFRNAGQSQLIKKITTYLLPLLFYIIWGDENAAGDVQNEPQRVNLNGNTQMQLSTIHNNFQN